MAIDIPNPFGRPVALRFVVVVSAGSISGTLIGGLLRTDTQMLGLQFRGEFLKCRERVVCTRQRHDRDVIGAG